MTEVIGVRFKKVGKVYYFDPSGVRAREGEHVIVETARGIECGEVVMPNREVQDDSIVSPLRHVIRIASDNDLKIMQENSRLEEEAFRICEEKIARHRLEMKLVAVEYTFDHSKILFYFSADGRIDFRELVKDLASVFRTRIELRQIGVRDEAKMIGGLGICGRPLCCTTFLDDFQPVSINMAKEQGLSLNPTKISGTCGRLMCCLKYESDTYKDLIRNAPKVDSVVDTPQGRGTVMDVSLLKGCCRVRLHASPDAPVVFSCADCGCGAREAAPAPAEEPVAEFDAVVDEAPAPAHEARPQRQRQRERAERSDRPRDNQERQQNRPARSDKTGSDQQSRDRVKPPQGESKPRPAQQQQQLLPQQSHPEESSEGDQEQKRPPRRRHRGGRGGQRRGNRKPGDEAQSQQQTQQ